MADWLKGARWTSPVRDRDTSASTRSGRASVFAALALAVWLALGGCASSPSTSAQTPTPATPQGHLSARIDQILAGSHATQQISSNEMQRTLAVTITLSDPVPRFAPDILRTQEHVKSLCFQIQRSVWTTRDLSPTQVTVAVLGPIYDDYAELITRGYGGAILSSARASQLAWASLDADSAWGYYDQTWLSSEFAPNQRFQATPALTPWV
jgi:hypothetical protein